MTGIKNRYNREIFLMFSNCRSTVDQFVSSNVAKNRLNRMKLIQNNSLLNIAISQNYALPLKTDALILSNYIDSN